MFIQVWRTRGGFQDRKLGGPSQAEGGNRMSGEAARQAARQTGSQPDRQTDRQTHTHTHTQTDTHTQTSIETEEVCL